MTHNSLGDAAVDALVIRELSRLPSLSPSAGFSNRVMSRVRLPQPKAVVLYHRAKAWALEPRRALALAGAYAVSATAALALFLPWLIGHSAAVRFAADWMTTRVMGGLRDWMLAGASWAMSSGLTDWFRSLSLSGGRLAVAAAVLTAVYAGCAALLHVLLRAPRGAHAANVRL